MHRCVVEAQPTRATSPPPHMAAMIDRDGQQIAHVPYVQICRRPVEIESIELSSRARAHARVMTNTHTRAHTVSLANVRAQRRTECVCVCVWHTFCVCCPRACSQKYKNWLRTEGIIETIGTLASAYLGWLTCRQSRAQRTVRRNWQEFPVRRNATSAQTQTLRRDCVRAVS